MDTQILFFRLKMVEFFSISWKLGFWSRNKKEEKGVWQARHEEDKMTSLNGQIIIIIIIIKTSSKG
jgi:hypothetical protein